MKIKQRPTTEEIDSFIQTRQTKADFVGRINKLIQESFETPFYRESTRGNYHLYSEVFEPLVLDLNLGLIASRPRLFLKKIVGNMYFGSFGEGKSNTENRDGSLIRVTLAYEQFAIEYAKRFEQEFQKEAKIVIVPEPWTSNDAYRVQLLTEKERAIAHFANFYECAFNFVNQ